MNLTVALSALLIVLGAAVVIRTILLGVGGGLGILIGALLMAAGAARLYLARSAL